MYSRGDLIQMGFTKAKLEYAAIKGLLDDIPRLRPGGLRVFSAEHILDLSIRLAVRLKDSVKLDLEKEVQGM